MQKITLYIATHNTTGLKYFGKSSKYFTESDLQKHYHGSGTYWTNHLSKYGDDVTMKIYGIYSIESVKEAANDFSEKFNIINSDAWANLIIENGLDDWDNTGTISVFSYIENKNIRISIDEFLNLSIGDVILLDGRTSETVSVFAENRLISTASIGQTNQNNAIRIHNVINGDEGHDKRKLQHKIK